MNTKGISLILMISATAIFMLLVLSYIAPQPLPHVARAADCSENPSQSVIILPIPDYKGLSLEEAIAQRRSVREYSNASLSLDELSQLLWAAQGITENETGKRAAPSAGATYPIELYVVPGRVEGAACGIYHYVPDGHKLVLHREGGFSEDVYRAAGSQGAAGDAAAIIVFTAVRERTARYGNDTDRFIAMEAGHISQDILLESVSLGLGAVPIGSFDEGEMDKILGIEGTGETSIYLNAVGRVD